MIRLDRYIDLENGFTADLREEIVIDASMSFNKIFICADIDAANYDEEDIRKIPCFALLAQEPDDFCLARNNNVVLKEFDASEEL